MTVLTAVAMEDTVTSSTCKTDKRRILISFRTHDSIIYLFPIAVCNLCPRKIVFCQLRLAAICYESIYQI